MLSRVPTHTARTLTAKIHPPSVSPDLLQRPALERRLREVLTHRMTVIVADAGFGKSTLLSSWAEGLPSAWYTLTPEDAALGMLARGLVDALRLRVPDLPPDLAAAMVGLRGPDAEADEMLRAQVYAGLLCQALEECLHQDLVLVLDDVDQVGSAEGPGRLIEALCRQAPATLHVVLASRTDLPFRIDRLRGRGQVLEITAGELAFAAEEVAELLAISLDQEARALAGPLYEATGGWPAAARLAIEAMRGVPKEERRPALERLRRPGGALFGYLASQVFRHQPDEVRRLIRTVAPLESFTPELGLALGLPDSAELLASLARRRLFLEEDRSQVGWFSLTPLVRRFVLESAPLDPAELRAAHTRAAAWFESHGAIVPALASRMAMGDQAGIARLLAEQGSELVARGATDVLIDVADALPAELRTTEIDALVGQARQIVGDWEEALVCFKRAAAGAERLSPGLAWRMGLIHHLRGELEEALAVYGKGRTDGDQPRDVALLLAWRAAAHWLHGDAEACQRDAAEALEAALTSGDAQALAAAHTALAMLAALKGDRRQNDAHYLRALQSAEQAGDILQIIRIRTNRGSHHLEEGAYEQALAELEIAIRLSDPAPRPVRTNLTNERNLEGASGMTVWLYDDRQFPATLLGKVTPPPDIALTQHRRAGDRGQRRWPQS